MKRMAILGSTGSIGSSTLKVIRRHPDRFKAVALAANSNIDELLFQVKEFSPESVCVIDEKAAARFAFRIKNKGIKLYPGKQGLKELISCTGIDRMVLAITGSSALEPLLTAIERKIDVALANKEALVMAGSIIMGKARRNNVRILPIDSEQSAIWQCLAKEDKRALKRIYLTASGGPFRKTSRSLFKKIKLKQVLKHPRWNMGRKITVDSATLMNKGFELLEAMALFDLSSDKVSILIHPEAICHSMVEFNDGVVMAQLSATDMRIPIQYALTFPDRLESGFSGIDFCALKSLNFEKPDFKKFPCLGLSLKAARMLGTMPAVLNAANEIAVNEFLAGNLRFFLIPDIVRTVMNRHKNIINPSLAQILAADVWAKQQAAAVIGKL